MKTKKVTPIIGDIVKITLEDGDACFSRVLEKPLFAFYDLKVKQVPSKEDIIKSPIMFKIWVMDYAITTNIWKIIGNIPLEQKLVAPVTFFTQDIISKKTYLYLNSEKIPATFEQCENLEKAAVWDPIHVEDRLRDYYLGVPNKWVESLKLKNKI